MVMKEYFDGNLLPPFSRLSFSLLSPFKFLDPRSKLPTLDNPELMIGSRLIGKTALETSKRATSLGIELFIRTKKGIPVLGHPSLY
jgi:hypothetical protein